jgi:hypothetical protein
VPEGCGCPSLLGFRDLDGALTERGHGVEAATRAIFCGRDERVLPAGFEEPGLVEAVESFVEGAVGGELAGLAGLADVAGDEVAVELGLSGLAEVEACAKDGDFEGEQGAGLASHEGIV